MRSHATWFVLLGILTLMLPYALGVRPRTPRDWQAIAITIAFLAWILLLMEPVL